MWFRSDHRGVSIDVQGDFVAPGMWLIRATVAGHPEFHTAIGEASRWRTLGALWRGIVHESRVGRRLGADTVRLVVDGDRDIVGLFAGSACDADRLTEKRRVVELPQHKLGHVGA